MIITSARVRRGTLRDPAQPARLRRRGAAATFRDRIGTGRKVAIQILEFFDRVGMSRRIGDSHKLFQDSLMQVR